jgi:hypothetical protein
MKFCKAYILSEQNKHEYKLTIPKAWNNIVWWIGCCGIFINYYSSINLALIIDILRMEMIRFGTTNIR